MMLWSPIETINSNHWGFKVCLKRSPFSDHGLSSSWSSPSFIKITGIFPYFIVKHHILLVFSENTVKPGFHVELKNPDFLLLLCFMHTEFIRPQRECIWAALQCLNSSSDWCYHPGFLYYILFRVNSVQKPADYHETQAESLKMFKYNLLMKCLWSVTLLTVYWETFSGDMKQIRGHGQSGGLQWLHMNWP